MQKGGAVTIEIISFEDICRHAGSSVQRCSLRLLLL